MSRFVSKYKGEANIQKKQTAAAEIAARSSSSSSSTVQTQMSDGKQSQWQEPVSKPKQDDIFNNVWNM